MPPVTIKKRFGHTASVTKGSNKITTCSKVDLSFIDNGSFVMINGDEIFYKVSAKNKFAYEQDAKVLGQELELSTNAGTMLNIDDDIQITYKEYEIASIEVVNGGEGYQEGDLISPQGGVCKYNSIDEIDAPAQLEVEEVDSDGAILTVKLINGGLYSVPPENNCGIISGLGSGGALNVTSKLLDTLSIDSRSITSIETSDDKTIIGINHALPPRIEGVKLKVEKWQLTISTEYAGESKHNVTYDIIKNFTPNYNLPLIQADTAINHLVYNEAMTIIDQRLKDLEDAK